MANEPVTPRTGTGQGAGGAPSGEGEQIEIPAGMNYADAKARQELGLGKLPEGSGSPAQESPRNTDEQGEHENRPEDETEPPLDDDSTEDDDETENLEDEEDDEDETAQ